jgi:hypothetical protein
MQPRVGQEYREVTFSGWVREAEGRWRMVCEAPSFNECWQLLLKEQSLGQFCEKIVIEKGRKP